MQCLDSASQIDRLNDVQEQKDYAGLSHLLSATRERMFPKKKKKEKKEKKEKKRKKVTSSYIQKRNYSSILQEFPSYPPPFHSARQLEQAAQLERLVIRRPAQPRQHSLVIQALCKVHIVRQLLNRYTGALLMENGSHLDVLVRRPLEVIRAARAVGHVEGALALGVPGGQDLEDVELAAAGAPARASLVLGSAGDGGVEGPDGGHIGVRAAGGPGPRAGRAARPVRGHLELEEEDLVGAAEALVRDRGDAREAAAGVALFRREDGEFRVGGDQDVFEDFRGRGAAGAGGVEVREGKAPDTRFYN